MLTPQEVSERAFPKASFGGYNMGQVDEFLDILTADYTSLYNENAVLKSKMKVLVDKVEEYRNTEDAMRKALMAAQQMADDLIQEANQKREEILRGAEHFAQQKVDAIRQEVDAEQFRLDSAKRSTMGFVAQVRALMEKQADYLENLALLCPDTPIPQPDPVEEAASEIDGNVQRLLAQAMAAATAENLKNKAGEAPPDLTDTAEFPAGPAAPPPRDEGGEAEIASSRIDFGRLKFGPNYEDDEAY